MARKLQLVLIAALGMTLVGCVSQDSYTALKLDRDRLAEQLATAQRDATEARALANSYKGQLDALAANGNNFAALIRNQAEQLAQSQADLAEMTRKYEELLGRAPVAGGGDALPKQLSDALREFALQNPDLVEFDAARGIVKFKSDVTFNTGDAELTAKAREVIDRFATILNSQAAAGYELMIAGHTDNAPVVNQSTISKGHKDNWFLSAHRAISVTHELMAKNVQASRLGVAGYADQRPVASNASEAGKAQNRRVEVLILPATIHIGGGSGTHSAKPAPAPVVPLNKDSTGPAAGSDAHPILGK